MTDSIKTMQEVIGYWVPKGHFLEADVPERDTKCYRLEQSASKNQVELNCIQDGGIDTVVWWDTGEAGWDFDAAKRMLRIASLENWYVNRYIERYPVNERK